MYVFHMWYVIFLRLKIIVVDVLINIAATIIPSVKESQIGGHEKYDEPWIKY